MLGNSVVVVVVVVVVRTRPRAMPLAMITIRKLSHGLPFLSHDGYGAPLLFIEKTLRELSNRG